MTLNFPRSLTPLDQGPDTEIGRRVEVTLAPCKICGGCGVFPGNYAPGVVLEPCGCDGPGIAVTVDTEHSGYRQCPSKFRCTCGRIRRCHRTTGHEEAHYGWDCPRCGKDFSWKDAARWAGDDE